MLGWPSSLYSQWRRSWNCDRLTGAWKVLLAGRLVLQRRPSCVSAPDFFDVILLLCIERVA